LEKVAPKSDLDNLFIAIHGDYIVNDDLWSEFNKTYNLKLLLLVEWLENSLSAIEMTLESLKKIDRFARLVATSA